ncbi:MAG TPA: hypothetical protein VFP63_01925 [Dehalococcoidia bacterium]|nr:hypothetical protein [Dehalococcoidia bacterium]
MRASRVLIPLSVLALVAAGVFVAAGVLPGESQTRERLWGEALPTPLPSTIQDQFPEVAADQQKPRFEGEMLGIYLAPPDVLEARGYDSASRAACPSGPEIVKDHPSIPPPPAYLPPRAFQTDEPRISLDRYNPLAVICKDTGEPLAAGRYFRLPRTQFGEVPYITIGRVFTREPFHMVEAPADRIQVTQLAGREAVLISPVVADTRGAPRADIIVVELLVPEDTGYVWVRTETLPLPEAMQVMESFVAVLEGKATPAAIPLATPLQ